jgi:hypothetical protein
LVSSIVLCHVAVAAMLRIKTIKKFQRSQSMHNQ